MGKIFYTIVVCGVIVVIGMLVYPTVHLNWIGISTTGWLPITKAGAVVASYGFLFFIVYGLYKASKGGG